MKNCKLLSIMAIALWVLGAGFIGYRIIAGDVSGVQDGRAVVELTRGEKDFVLQEMRTLLTSIHGIAGGIRNGDMKAVESAARKSGMAMAADVNPALMMKIPMDFKSRGMDVHRQFDDFAERIQKSGDREKAIVFLDEQLARCVSCHSAYRLIAQP